MGFSRGVMRALIVIALALILFFPLSFPSQAEGDEVILTVLGRVVTTQGQAIPEAAVRVLIAGQQQPLLADGEEVEEIETTNDGSYVADLRLPRSLIEDIENGRADLVVEVVKPTFRTTRHMFEQGSLAEAGERFYARLDDIVLPHIFNFAFFITTGVFLIVFGLISFNLLHETIAAFLGAAAMLGVTYILGSFTPDFWIISFERAIHFIDFDVIFLLMSMMIFMAIMSQTGIFGWLAFKSYQLARGRVFLLVAILVIITGLTSSVLNNTTVMLVMAPVSVEIALALGVHPFSLVIPEVMASNIGGAATLIGDPPNTIIGSYVGLTFNQFLVNMGPIAGFMMIVLLIMTRFLYAKEFKEAHAEISPALLKRLEEDSRITDHQLLRKSLIIFAVTMILFFIEDQFHMPPSVAAIIGATALLLWVRPSIDAIMKEVDWTTLVFFMSLFIIVGGTQEVGLIQAIADFVKNLAGDNLLLATMLVIWVSGVASGVVANIPYTAAMLPITVYLTKTIPGAENNVLYWALSLGACLGGNGTYIGSAPNIVAVGVLERAGYRLSFHEFLKVGVPVTFVTLLLPAIWFVIRYF